jgi:broad specificity phosphatase PhoE
VPGGGESRAELAGRFARAFELVLDRPEATVLVVGHGLPLRYVLNAAAGSDPTPLVEQVEYAVPYPLPAERLRLAVDRLRAWAAAPTW